MHAHTQNSGATCHVSWYSTRRDTYGTHIGQHRLSPRSYAIGEFEISVFRLDYFKGQHRFCARFGCKSIPVTDTYGEQINNALLSDIAMSYTSGIDDILHMLRKLLTIELSDREQNLTP